MFVLCFSLGAVLIAPLLLSEIFIYNTITNKSLCTIVAKGDPDVWSIGKGSCSRGKKALCVSAPVFESSSAVRFLRFYEKRYRRGYWLAIAALDLCVFRLYAVSNEFGVLWWLQLAWVIVLAVHCRCTMYRGVYNMACKQFSQTNGCYIPVFSKDMME